MPSSLLPPLADEFSQPKLHHEEDLGLLFLFFQTVFQKTAFRFTNLDFKIRIFFLFLLVGATSLSFEGCFLVCGLGKGLVFKDLM